MGKDTTNPRISKVGITDETLTGRGGLALFSRYLERVGLLRILAGEFSFIRLSKKGLPLVALFKQILCFFFDGTSRHITYFDHLQRDAGYAGEIETVMEKMASSHVVKRFFAPFAWHHGRAFRWVLQRLFVWRLAIEMPAVIEFTIDTMVMDNDEAQAREGVSPTYKKVKGFHPLHAIWNGRIIDAIFRGGKKHGNFGKLAADMIFGLVELIREKYDKDVPIIVRLDSAFFDIYNFAALDWMGVAFIASGKMYAGVKEQASVAAPENWRCYDNGRQAWKYLEFGFRCDDWPRFYRAIYTRPEYDGEQRTFDFARPDNVIITNIGVSEKPFAKADAATQAHWQNPETIIHGHHMRGADELPHRGLKDFGFEQLPFKRFGANSAFYYCMVIAFFLFECFKRDVTHDVLPVTAYATTIRRRLVDIAAKLVKKSGRIVLRVARATMEALRFDLLWANCNNPPPIPA